MTQQLMRSEVTATGPLMVPGQSYEDVKVLDVYAQGMAEEETRLDALATISAGWKNDKGMPQVSRDRKIKLHDPGGRAPGLKAALEREQYMRLLVAFPFDEPSSFVFQRFAEYSASRTIFSGNERGITFFREDGVREFFEAGSTGYVKALSRAGMKVENWVYFHMAEIDEDGAFVVFPDGGLPYRHRFTSRNSLRTLRSALNYIRRFTGGRLAGIPFELAIDNRDVADGEGARHTAPVWTWTPKLTADARLDSRQFSRMVRVALAQGEALRMLPAPTFEAIEAAALSEPAIEDEDDAIREPTDTEIGLMADGGLCDYAHWVKTWHALARDTAFASDEARAAFIGSFTDGGTDSLSEYLEHATEARAAELIAELGAAITNARAQASAAKYDAIFGDDDVRQTDLPDDAPAPPAETSFDIESESQELSETAAMADALTANKELLKRAQATGKKGLGKYTAEPSWAVDRVQRANQDLQEMLEPEQADAALEQAPF